MNEAIIIFTRAPVPGKTKTRLQPHIGPEHCAGLHGAFIKDIYRACEGAGRDIFVFYTPKEHRGILEELIGKNVIYIPQSEKGLGVRMLEAIGLVLSKGYKSCILVGTDVPQMKSEYCEEAFEMLKGCDVVLGPTYDKGYYLVGMKKLHKETFENQSYGKDDVISNTMEGLERAGLEYALARPCLDIDDGDDLSELKRLVEKGKELNCTNTIEYLLEMDICKGEGELYGLDGKAEKIREGGEAQERA